MLISKKLSCNMINRAAGIEYVYRVSGNNNRIDNTMLSKCPNVM